MKNINFDSNSQLKTIGNYAFTNCTSMSELQLPATVTSIGNYAFSGCSSMAKFNSAVDGEFIVPANIITIGEYAFQNLGLMTKVVVPESVTNIGFGAFEGCNSIEDITLPFVGKSADATHYAAVFGYIFGYSIKGGNSIANHPYGVFLNEKFGGQPSNTIWQYSLYDSITSSAIYEYSFYYYIPTTIKNVTITKQTALPVAAFNGCYFIETITIPNTVSSIGDYAFQNCSALKRFNSTTDGEFNVPVGVTTIGPNTFYACKK